MSILGLTALPLKRSLESSEAGLFVRCLADLPRELRSAGPVHDCDKVKVSLRHRHISDVGEPHLVQLSHLKTFSSNEVSRGY